MTARKKPAEVANTCTDRERHEWMKTATAKELEALLPYLSPAQNDWHRAQALISLRIADESRRIHWTTTINLALTFIATLIAIVAFLRPPPQQPAVDPTRHLAAPAISGSVTQSPAVGQTSPPVSVSP